MTGLITAPGFDINRTEEYKLSTQVSLDGFSFSAIDIQQNELLALENTQFKLSSDKFLARHFTEWFSNKEYLNRNYGSYNLIWFTERYTYIPTSFYDNTLKNLPANLILGNLNNSKYISNEIKGGSLVFPVDPQVLDAMAGKFPSLKLQHPLTILDAALRSQEKIDSPVLIAYFRTDSFSLILYNNNKLLLTNSYTYHDAGDFLYYAMAAMSRLGLTSKVTKLLIAGEFSPLSKLHSHLVKYFLKTQFLLPGVDCNRSLFKEPLYRHIVLF